MSKFIIFITYLITVTAFSQTESSFQSQMELALNQEQDDLKIERLKTISKDFENEWLADYYLADLTIKNSMAYLYNEEALKKSLDKAQSYLDKAYLVDNNEAEMLIMQAKLYMVYVISNGEKYGRKYAPIMTNIYNKAENIAPNNPRVVLSKAQWDMGMAKYFGSSTDSFCIAFEKAVNLFNTFKIESKIHPNWGLPQAIEAKESCNN